MVKGTHNKGSKVMVYNKDKDKDKSIRVKNINKHYINNGLCFMFLPYNRKERQYNVQ